jgi:glycosyltransferase involved in cell wall biosynthesis
MKIFFDGKIFSSQKVGGISRVNFELIKELSNVKDVEKIFYRGFYIDEYLFEKKWFYKYYGIKIPNFLKSRLVNFLDNFFLNFFYNIFADEKTIYHSSYYRVPKNPKGPVVVHCYDMMHELFNINKKVINFKKSAFNKADLIIAISESTKKDLCKIYPDINPEKVAVVYLGGSDIFFKKHEKLKNKKPYMLYVGMRNYKYKNFDFLLDVFIKERYYLKYDLVLVGGEKELTFEQTKKIKKTGNENWIIQNFGTDEELAELYAGAKVFIYPSLYEGFGIPPLEAMASGCPVLASNCSSVPEVVADAGILFNPKDRKDFINKLNEILENKELSIELVEKGKKRAKEFTWEKITYRMCQLLGNL